MATAAEPRPAELPLPGGREGASVRLHPLLCGRSVAPPAYLLREAGRLAPLRGLEIDAGQALPAQLRERGIEPSSVGTVVMTHMHIDHASGISEFPGATFLVSRGEWDAAGDQGPTHGYVKRQFDHAFDYRLLDFEGASREGAGSARTGATASDVVSFSGFARSFDVFGDGSLRVVYTPGHTLGHMSVVMRTARGEVLVAGDAMYLRRTLADTHLPYRTEDEHLFRRSLREIRRYADETPGALIIPGHDWEA